ncbi:hypothetical protein RCIP0093_00011 [Klebsiella phage RCIP0093]|jgi:hypothetical protein
MSNDFIAQCETELDKIDTILKPYAYEVTTNRGTTYLVRADSVAHNNAVMFGYKLKPLYEGE